MHIFASDVYYHNHKDNRDGKLDVNAWKGIFVGYDHNNDSIIVY